MEMIEAIAGGTITTPQGFSAGATYAGIKKKNDDVLDLGIVYSQEPCTVAGVFTTNKVKSAAVVLDQQALKKKKKFSAVVVNSGCANSSTGEQGLEDAFEMAAVTGKALGLEPEEVLVASTGVIGVPLPMESIREGVNKIVLSPEGGHEFTRAIMTTDTVQKEIAFAVKTKEHSFTVAGVAKGSGMIHPNLATMLVFITTDAAVETEFLELSLKSAAEISFNMISVDGDTSPSDTVLLLANGSAGNEPIRMGSLLAPLFQEALNRTCTHLAKAIASDGEGATKLIEMTVKGAVNLSEARRAARTVVSSNLVKAAVYGNDPNWGRVTAALGRSGVELDEIKLDVEMAGIPVLKAGRPVPFERQTAVDALKQKEVKIVVNLNIGEGTATAWGCDLTEQYVVINSAYTT
jgi:glutamate N-acetyltransferase/amino-acid N-acetyltransferase